MRIEAATLAGGEINQDYYAYGDTYALVLDGASSFLPEQTSIDAATYVKALGTTLAYKLENCALEEIPDAVASAIEIVAERYELVEESSPNSTVVIAKWNQGKIAVYVLGDSSCVLVDKEGRTTEITDSRMNHIGGNFREEYRNRLSEGYGFDAEHKRLLRELQKAQRRHRNNEGGYWIAGSLPSAAERGVSQIYRKDFLEYLLLGSDGGILAIKNWIQVNGSFSVKTHTLDLLLAEHNRENKDFTAKHKPRSKIHDDKTLIVIQLG